VVSIPVHPSLTDGEVDAVIEAVIQTAAELGPMTAERAVHA
jgi:dTDP-4-amino-4,6-dideoxygalactose transaminase